ncbi:hypothetical protein QCA50_002456 [Cerrena zonata]|uniref:F-box domain-containing protein n=1 Tax=Cerrena zonata TaxID=2478898 RepID=A0AAW0GZ74_9APHY
MSFQVSQRSVDTLPPELIYEIFDLFGLEEDIELSKRNIYAISQTNRRLRQLALHYLCRSVELSWSDVDQLASRKCGTDIDRTITNKVRDLSLTCVDADEHLVPAILKRLRESKGFHYFSNLSVLDLTDTCIEPEDLANFGISVSLQALLVVWRMEHGFPDLAKWPQLSTLAIGIEMVGTPDRNLSLFQPVSNSNLTRLYIDEDHCELKGERDRSFRVGWFSKMCNKITLPRLRSFTIHSTYGLFAQIYDFIQRHPSILDVNISCGSRSLWLSFEAIIKLIEGTGIWSDDGTAHGPRDDPEARSEHPCWAFAFTRVPDTTIDHQNRYLATSLVLEQAVDGMQDWDVIILEDFLRLGNLRVFSKVETLRLLFTRCEESGGPFATIMRMVANELKCWPSLRSFHLAMFLTWEVTWEDLPESLDGLLPFFDEAMPMNECWSERLYTLLDLFETLDNLPPFANLPYYPQTREQKCKMVHIIYTEISKTLNIPMEKLDMEDAAILMTFWYKRHRDKMAALVWHIGAECKTLEEFVWYPHAHWVDRNRMRNKWSWVFGEPDGRGGRVAEDLHEWVERSDAPDDLTRMDTTVGEMKNFLEERWDRKPGFNPTKAYWGP